MQYLLNPALDRVTPSGIRAFTAMAKARPDCVMLTIGEPDQDTPRAVSEAAAAALTGGDTHYPANAGDLYLRQAIAEHDGRYSADQIIVTVGSTEAFFTALTTIICPGDRVVIPTPAFGLYEQITYIVNGEPVFMDTSADGFQITEDALKKAIDGKTKAIILTSPNNPTGAVLNERSLENVRRAVRGTNVFVLCDEVYADLIYGDRCPRFSDFSDMRDRVIVFNSFSKSWAMTGWRMGWMAAPEKVISKAALVHAYNVVSVASFSQKGCLEALRTDPSPMREIYRRRLDIVCEGLDRMGLDYYRPEGAFYIFPSIKKLGIPDTVFAERAIKEAAVAVTPGSCFGTPDHIRISYACADDRLKLGLERLEGFIRSL